MSKNIIKLDRENRWVNLDRAEIVEQTESGYIVSMSGDADSANVLVGKEDDPIAYKAITDFLNPAKTVKK